MGRYEADHILFGAAYYDEYLMMKGIDRIDEDMAMMKAAGLNVIRIAESTWSTCEPQPGVFDFTYVDRALDAANRAGIDVIVGTPTYAVPSWLVKLDPSVLAVTPSGQGKYGARQIMDIVNATYRFYGERVIRKLISHVADHPAVIGYQVDNETKYYDSVSDDMQRLFVKYLREKFHGDLDELNHHFGLDYWSNRIDSWEDFPDVTAIYDTRDNLTAPKRGMYIQFMQLMRQKFIGNKYNSYTTDFRIDGYTHLWKGATLAADFRTQLNFGDVEWSMLAQLGDSYSMRGYYQGRYRDNHKIETQVELRQHVWKRNGVVAWVGAGTIFPKFSKIQLKHILPNMGVGYRWEFKKNVNVRLDYGFGKSGQHSFIFNINEAF